MSVASPHPNIENVYKPVQQINGMDPKYVAFVKDMIHINKKLPYFNVSKDGFGYVVTNLGWTAHTDLNTTRVEVRGHIIVIKDSILVDGEEFEALCWRGRCLSASGINVRLGAVILAYYSTLDQLNLPCYRKRLLYYINKVEENPEIAEFAAVALTAKTTLSATEVEKIRSAMLREISNIRRAKYAHA